MADQSIAARRRGLAGEKHHLSFYFHQQLLKSRLLPPDIARQCVGSFRLSLHVEGSRHFKSRNKDG